MFTIAEPLIEWFIQNRREMPWRSDPTPYHVLVSEIMLQQTQVDTVRPYYAAFIREFPDFAALASCSDDRLMKRWEGLGYYTRARSLKKTAAAVVSAYGGTLPDDYDTLLKLPGIGAYTAGAVMSIAFRKPYPVVDGNVLRVWTRLTADPADISEEKTKKAIAEALSGILRESGCDPSLFNQGLMELGALVCRKNGQPGCEVCPLNRVCLAYAEGRVADFPVKAPKKPKRIEEMTVFILRYRDDVMILKRPPGGLLSGLYAFPTVSGFLDEAAAAAYLEAAGAAWSSVKRLPDARHIFTHVVWEMRAFLVELSLPFSGEKTALLRASREELKEKYALPGAMKKWENLF